MNQFEYSLQNLNKYKSTSIAVVLTHQAMHPYVNQFDYFKHITYPRFKRYCQDYNIDLVTITDFKKNQYQSSQPSVFGKRITMYPFHCILQLMKHYDYVTTFSSNAILHKNMPSLYDMIDYDYDCIAPQKCMDPISNQFQSALYTLLGSAAQPQYDRIKVLNYYKNRKDESFWTGPHILVNKKMYDWFNPQLIFKFQSNDMITRFVQYATNKDKTYKLKSQKKLNMFSMNLYLRSLLKDQKDVSLSNIQKVFINNLSLFKQRLESNQAVISYFGGCGSYSNLWMLRPLLMKQVVSKLNQLYY